MFSSHNRNSSMSSSSCSSSRFGNKYLLCLLNTLTNLLGVNSIYHRAFSGLKSLIILFDFWQSGKLLYAHVDQISWRTPQLAHHLAESHGDLSVTSSPILTPSQSACYYTSPAPAPLFLLSPTITPHYHDILLLQVLLELTRQKVTHEWLDMAQALNARIQKTSIAQICERILAAEGEFSEDQLVIELPDVHVVLVAGVTTLGTYSSCR